MWQLVSFIIYIIFVKNPFSFFSDDRKIDQNVITSSVVNIWCQSSIDENDISGGSGTIITTDGTVITNSHVIPQNETNILTSEEGLFGYFAKQTNWSAGRNLLG